MGELRCGADEDSKCAFLVLLVLEVSTPVSGDFTVSGAAIDIDDFQFTTNPKAAIENSSTIPQNRPT